MEPTAVSRFVVLYTDPSWAVRDGRAHRSLATVEHHVLGDDVELRLGPCRDGRYVTSGADLRRAAAGANAIGVYRCRVTEELLDAAGPGLKVVVRQGVGTDNLNVPLLATRGIHAVNVPDYCVDEVATHTIALALALERRIVPQHLRLSSGTFDIYRGGIPRRLFRRTAGIVGFGRIGRAVAVRLRAFYGSVLTYDPYIGADLPEGYGVRMEGFEELLESSDLVTLHCPLNEETRGMIDASALARMKADALLVNCARGGLIDSRALHRALDSGRLGGAGLDVFSPENPFEDEWYPKILAMPNVVATSHRAFLSADAEASSRLRVAEEIRNVLVTGTPRTGVVRPDEVPGLRRTDAWTGHAREEAPARQEHGQTGGSPTDGTNA
jgi:phosphoglycerate dehydrogenase-like enzyme